MNNKNFIILCMLIVCGVANINAQIGYQVSLLNSATGEPRANETVSVTLEITNSEGAVVCNETKSATTNEFGVLSLSVGSSNTFANMDWSKLPLYISATVDGVMVGRSQILTVPVAEAAKTLVNVAPELICKTWSATPGNYDMSITLLNNFTYIFTAQFLDGEYSSEPMSASGKYLVQGNLILLCNVEGGLTFLFYDEGKLYGAVFNITTEFH